MRRSRTVHDGGESIVPPRERGSLFGQVVVSVVMLRTDICGHVVENTITVILWNAESGHSRLQSATQIMRAGRIRYPTFFLAAASFRASCRAMRFVKCIIACVIDSGLI